MFLRGLLGNKSTSLKCKWCIVQWIYLYVFNNMVCRLSQSCYVMHTVLITNQNGEFPCIQQQVMQKDSFSSVHRNLTEMYQKGCSCSKNLMILFSILQKNLQMGILRWVYSFKIRRGPNIVVLNLEGTVPDSSESLIIQRISLCTTPNTSLSSLVRINLKEEEEDSYA